jgi:outer membrane protein OmpA-like peptidoglycan-associated protein
MRLNPDQRTGTFKENSMRYPSLFTSSVFCLGLALALPQAADAQDIDPLEARRYGNLGALTGAVIGAVVGGPPGAVVTAAAGGWLSDKLLTGKHNRLLQASLASAREELLALQQNHAALQQDYQLALQAETGNGLLASADYAAPSAPACCGNSEVTIHFRSNSAEVEPHYRADLESFIVTVHNTPKPVITMIGHADRRGDSRENLYLSQQRLQQVERKLRELGLASVVIETTALGSSVPLTRLDSYDSNFFDRRVVLQVRSDREALLSSTR